MAQAGQPAASLGMMHTLMVSDMVGFKPLEMQSFWCNDSSKPMKLLDKGKDGAKEPKET